MGNKAFNDWNRLHTAVRVKCCMVFCRLLIMLELYVASGSGLGLGVRLKAVNPKP